MTRDNVLARLEALVATIAGPERMPDGAGPDTPLGDEGFWFDSLDMLEVILACEREFGVIFDARSDLSPDALLTPRRLATLVRSRLEG